MQQTLSYIILVSRLAGIISFICFLIAVNRKVNDQFYTISFAATIGFFTVAFILWLVKLFRDRKG
jgi:hypothetical protein